VLEPPSFKSGEVVKAMKQMQSSKLKKLSLAKPIKLSTVKPAVNKKTRPMPFLFSLSVLLLAGASPAFVFYSFRLLGQAPQGMSTSLPVKAVGTPVSGLPPTSTPTEGPALLIADHFSYPVDLPINWAIQQDFSQKYSATGGGWHTGEDWVISPQVRDRWGQHVLSSGQQVLATAAGKVLYAEMIGYPCGVVVLEHILSTMEVVYSVYSHIEGLTVVEDAEVQAGQVIGQICSWPGAPDNSHLHFEIRSFYLTDHVNGDNAACILRHKNFPPGPGYWPICGSYRNEKPTDEGWLDPSDFILAHRPADEADSALNNLSVSTSLPTPTVSK
jgi:murein DD-endopeptidase MepM/ murein hydrolase activator NlpD